MKAGQRVALDQLRAIDSNSPEALEVLSVDLPDDSTSSLLVRVSVDCRGIEHKNGGLRLRDRERFTLMVGPDFPFAMPTLTLPHLRWAGTPHVQWGLMPCLYVAPSVEWDPGQGMFGYLKRLWLWLNEAAAGQLDPDDAPMHPPVAYQSASDDVPLIIPRVDTPGVSSAAWIGGVELKKVSASRVDLGRWDESIESWRRGHAPAVLIPGTLDFEYPRTVRALLDALDERGVPKARMLAVLKVAADELAEGEPLFLVLGTAMRGTADDRRQHLAVWYVAPLMAWGLAHSLKTNDDDPDRNASARKVEGIMEQWAENAKVEWCPVREDRPEVTQRRDAGSPMEWFAGKTVAIWGSGALGGPIAEWIARAGASKLILYDNATVTPGVLVRQLFSDADIGTSKARALGERLRTLFPDQLQVKAESRNVLGSVLNRADWHDGADLVIDATASTMVATKLERTRREQPQPAALISVILGHTARHSIGVLAPPGYSGAGADVMRQVKLACGRQRTLRGFLAEFWPDPPRGSVFQPEPGCSDPTFTGAGADVAALAAPVLAQLAGHLNGETPDAVAYLATTAADHPGVRDITLRFAPARRVVVEGSDVELRIARSAGVGVNASIERGRREHGATSETGGLLFGERDSAAGVVWVDEVMGPPPDSRRSPEEFICGIEGVEVAEAEKTRRGRGSLGYLGMWHTHPTQAPRVSDRDLAAIVRMLDAASSPLSSGLMLIFGRLLPGPPQLGAYIFERSELVDPHVSRLLMSHPGEMTDHAPPDQSVGLALSGGGSRAVAFHLGCLRALHDRGILQRARVMSAVSGGSVITALWAYSQISFQEFEERTQALLRDGLQRRIARRALLSARTPQQLGTKLVAGTTAVGARAISLPLRGAGRRPVSPPLRRWASRTDAFLDVLAHDLDLDCPLGAPRRDSLDVVINATDLRTGSSFRFGSRESGCWRIGKLDQQVSVATAVAASAAYPLALPALDRSWAFQRKDGAQSRERVLLTDGGVYDNLGTSCLEPGRDPRFGFNIFEVDYIIACDAGRGLMEQALPYGWLTRVKRSFEATFRKLQDGGRGRLHDLAESGDLAGFAMPYLGQQDHALPVVPADLVARERVADCPTDFRAMKQPMIDLLSRRGEQLTNALLDSYLPEL